LFRHSRTIYTSFIAVPTVLTATVCNAFPVYFVVVVKFVKIHFGQHLFGSVLLEFLEPDAVVSFKVVDFFQILVAGDDCTLGHQNQFFSDAVVIENVLVSALLGILLNCADGVQLEIGKHFELADEVFKQTFLDSNLQVLIQVGLQ